MKPKSVEPNTEKVQKDVNNPDKVVRRIRPKRFVQNEDTQTYLPKVSTADFCDNGKSAGTYSHTILTGWLRFLRPSVTRSFQTF